MSNPNHQKRISFPALILYMIIICVLFSAANRQCSGINEINPRVIIIQQDYHKLCSDLCVNDKSLFFLNPIVDR